MVEDDAERSAPAAAALADEQRRIQQLAQPKPGETSWDAVTRKRALIAFLQEVVKRDMPGAVEDARKAKVSMRDLAEAWGVTDAWLYTVSPSRRKKRQTGE